MPAPYQVNPEIRKLKAERERELMSIPGVVGVGLGREDDHDVIVIMSERDDRRLRVAVSKIIKGGVRYIVRRTGEFRAGAHAV